MDDVEADSDKETTESSDSLLNKGKRARPQSPVNRDMGVKRQIETSEIQSLRCLDVIISALGGLPVAAFHPSKFWAALQTAVGGVKSVRKVRSKHLSVTCVSASQVNKVLKVTSIMGSEMYLVDNTSSHL